MAFPSFKEHLALMEARGGGRKYTEKQVKGVLDKVTVTLQGAEAGSMTKLLKRYARLEASMKAMKEKHEILNTRLKDDIQEMFNAEDVVVTRVVETAQFTATMAKEIQKTEGSKEVDYEKIIAALSALISEELQPRIDGIIEKYTKIIPPKAPVKRLSVSKEVVKEATLGARVEYDSYKMWKADLPAKSTFHKDGHLERAQAEAKDFGGVAGTWNSEKKSGWIYEYYLKKSNLHEGILGNLTNLVKSFVKSIMSWATRYDSKLERIKDQFIKTQNNLRERHDSDFL